MQDYAIILRQEEILQEPVIKEEFQIVEQSKLKANVLLTFSRIEPQLLVHIQNHI